MDHEHHTYLDRVSRNAWDRWQSGDALTDTIETAFALTDDPPAALELTSPSPVELYYVRRNALSYAR